MSTSDVSPDVSPDVRMGPKMVQRLAKVVPRKLLPRNKPIVTWLNGVENPSLLPRYRILVVCQAEKKIFDLTKILVHGKKFSIHHPLVPEPIDGNFGVNFVTADKTKKKIAPDFVYQIVGGGKPLVVEFVVAKTEISAGQDGTLNFPVDEKLLGPGFSINEYEVPFLWMLYQILEERGLAGGWLTMAKAKIVNLVS